MRVTHLSRHPVPPEKVIGALCSEAYNLDVERGREGVLETRFETIRKDDRHAVLRLVTTEHARTKTGGLDRTRTLQSTTDIEVDLARNELTWRYSSDQGSRVRLSGSLRVDQDSDGSRVEQTVDIEVSIPLLGAQIARYIGKEMEKTLPKTAEVLGRHLA
jgi:hypothetical protein